MWEFFRIVEEVVKLEVFWNIFLQFVFDFDSVIEF